MSMQGLNYYTKDEIFGETGTASSSSSNIQSFTIESYTVPMAGKYLVLADCAIHPYGYDYRALKIFQNGTEKLGMQSYQSERYTQSINTILTCEAGDTILIRLDANDSNFYCVGSTWSIVKIG